MPERTPPIDDLGLTPDLGTPDGMGRVAPAFGHVDDERLDRKQRLAAALRIFGALGFDEGVAGHITARDPGEPEHFWVNPFGMSFRHVRVSDLVLIDEHGTIVEGRGPVNRAAFMILAAVHAARPDVVAAAHAHSVHGRAWSTLGRLLDPLTQDACAFYEDHALYDEYHGVVFDSEEGKRVAHALGGHKAAILQNHGLLTVGRSVDEACYWFVTMDRSCQVQLLAEAAGTPKPIPHEAAALTAAQIGTHGAGRYGFEPLYAWISRSEPDLFD